MAESTGIGWTDATFNPWVGCEKVSPGCAHCYAEELVTGRMGRAGTWGSDGRRERTSASNRAKPLRWARLAAQGRLPDGSENRDGHRPRVFCASLADVFEPLGYLDPWRRDLFALIDQTPALDWLLLTKRPEEARDWLRARYWPFGGLPPLAHVPESHGCPSVPSEPYLSNVWIGTSVENSRFTWRADVLREIPAAVRFISAEPLLGSLFASGDICRCGPNSAGGSSEWCERCEKPKGAVNAKRPLDLSGIDWLIVGGESGGRDARPMHPDWARELRDACLAEPERRVTLAATCSTPVECEHGYDVCPICDETRPAFFFKQFGSYDECGVYRGPSPKASGDLLDGRRWQEFPQGVACAVA